MSERTLFDDPPPDQPPAAPPPPPRPHHAAPGGRAEGRRRRDRVLKRHQSRYARETRLAERLIVRHMLGRSEPVTVFGVLQVAARRGEHLPAGVTGKQVANAPKNLARAGVVEKCGPVESDNPRHHGGYISAWRLVSDAAGEEWLRQNPELPEGG